MQCEVIDKISSTRFDECVDGCIDDRSNELFFPSMHFTFGKRALNELAMATVFGWIHFDDCAADHLAQAGFIPTRRKMFLIFETSFRAVE